MVPKHLLSRIRKKTIAFTRYFQKFHSIKLSNSKKSHCNPKGGLILGTIHFRRRQFFTIFNPYPPPSAVFLLLFVSKFDQFFDLQIADVLNGWF